MNYNKEVIEKHFNLKIEKSLGYGENGNAFLTSKDSVIKITTDLNEFIFASQLLKNKIKNLVEIFEIATYQDKYIIHQEKVHCNDDIISDFICIKEIGMYERTDLCNICLDNEMLTSHQRSMLKDVQDAICDAKSKNTRFVDVHEFNIGISKNGIYKLFDQKKIYHNKEEIYKELELKVNRII